MPKPIPALALAAAALALALTVILYPQPVFLAAGRALELWAGAVVPALLPFFLLSHLLMGLGVIHALGMLLEPLMRPLFRLPGAAAPVMVIGYSTGAPVAAQLAGQLYEQRLCTRGEAERLVAFTTNASPLFIFGTVAVGLMKHPEVGAAIAAAHYGANLLLGLAWRWHRGADVSPAPVAAAPGALLRQAIAALLAAQRQDGRPLGQLLADAVGQAVRTLCLVGGFMVFFAVVLAVLEVAGIGPGLEALAAAGLRFLGLEDNLALALTRGFWEMTLGAEAAAAASAPLSDRVLMVAGTLSWAGLSIHAQVASVLSRTGLSLVPFVLTRCGQALLAPLLLYLFWKPVAPAAAGPLSGWSVWQLLETTLMLTGGLLAAAVGASLVASWMRCCLRRY